MLSRKLNEFVGDIFDIHYEHMSHESLHLWGSQYVPEVVGSSREWFCLLGLSSFWLVHSMQSIADSYILCVLSPLWRGITLSRVVVTLSLHDSHQYVRHIHVKHSFNLWISWWPDRPFLSWQLLLSNPLLFLLVSFRMGVAYISYWSLLRDNMPLFCLYTFPAVFCLWIIVHLLLLIFIFLVW